MSKYKYKIEYNSMKLFSDNIIYRDIDEPSILNIQAHILHQIINFVEYDENLRISEYRVNRHYTYDELINTPIDSTILLDQYNLLCNEPTKNGNIWSTTTKNNDITVEFKILKIEYI